MFVPAGVATCNLWSVYHILLDALLSHGVIVDIEGFLRNIEKQKFTKFPKVFKV